MTFWISSGIGKFTVGVRTNGISVDNLEMYAYTDANFSTPVAGYTNGNIAIDPVGAGGSSDVSMELSSTLQVPAGETYYFAVIGDISGVDVGDSIATFLWSDSDYASADLATFDSVNNSSNNNFIWTPNTDGLSSKSDTDWTNGFGILTLNSALHLIMLSR